MALLDLMAKCGRLECLELSNAGGIDEILLRRALALNRNMMVKIDSSCRLNVSKFVEEKLSKLVPRKVPDFNDEKFFYEFELGSLRVALPMKAICKSIILF